MRKKKLGLLHPRQTLFKLKWCIKKRRLKRAGKEIVVYGNVVLHEPENISIGDQVKISHGCNLETWRDYHGKPTGFKPDLIIGNGVVITDNVFISCMNKVEIGDGTLIGVNSFICDNFHGNNSADQMTIPPNERPLWSKGPVIIGRNVWIGRNVCIMPNVTIGDGAIIGANAVVTRDIPPNSIAVGVPAKIEKYIVENDAIID